ncbi:MerR family transcriptional regulator [Methylobacterium radiodurans]|uniref:MerR family transcriptional regulator n=1 Tax=Methylobacterium radiodurans TaxID=2202828 RepID=A0A2U8VPM9_9HYPH|nr:MerR family transcriptional regulator [Methylobacterium radiodurans]AWN35567.1 MerR family transcriptional regulator [Methylobacterium radiodurans]
MQPAPPAASAADPGPKQAGAFRTISEVSEALDVPQHVLRFWETRFGQVRPLKRAGGRRYYRPEDVALIAGIRQLLHVQRYTIQGAQRVLRENGVRFVQAVGRGEVVAAAPEAPETQRDAAPLGPDPATRAALEAVLAELHACRDALAALRAGRE